jgi:hypothetical protein
MTDRLHETEFKKPPAIALSGVWRGLMGRDNGGNINNVQYKSNWNHHYESPFYNEYILIKIYNKNIQSAFLSSPQDFK